MTKDGETWMAWAMISLMVLVIGTSAIELGMQSMSWQAHLEAEKKQFEQMLSSHFVQYSQTKGAYATEGRQLIDELAARVKSLENRLGED